MTLVQLEYIVAVDTYKSFVAAADKCFVTQPTLSMQIQKLEEWLNVKIFDRSKQPIVSTEMGSAIIAQARKILAESARMQEIIAAQQKTLVGELKLGIIPTVAPYLLPEIIAVMQQKYPQLQLQIWEYTTNDIVQQLNNGRLDCGLLATPLESANLVSTALYYEPFVGYVSEKSPLFAHDEIKAKDFENEDIWLLTEGHCMRSQVLQICRNHKNSRENSLVYQTGSVETLIRMVDINQGTTLLPQMSLHSLSPQQLQKVRRFKPPEPVREISLVRHPNFVKTRMMNALKDEIISLVPGLISENAKKTIIPIQI
jgi:LysR family hydrogen peroxide-inducible transcriptional activator